MTREQVLLKFLEKLHADLPTGLQAVETYLDGFPEEFHDEQRREHAALLGSAVPGLAGGGTQHDAPFAGRLGRYRLEGLLGRGGFGLVFRAVDELSGATVAVKILDHVAAVSPAARARFQREVQATRQLQHPAICPVLDAELDGETPFLVMPLVAGGSLAQRLQVQRRAGVAAPLRLQEGVTVEQSVRLLVTCMAEVADAIQVAHEGGVLHRDLKPANVLFGTDGRPRVVDFGLAWIEDAASKLTQSQPVGTFAYLPPEVFDGGGRGFAPRVDVWGLGVTLLECLQLAPAWQGSTPRQIQRASRLGRLARLPRGIREVLPGLDVVLRTALRRRPEDRYATAGEFADDLRRILAGEAPRSRPLTLMQRLTGAIQARPGVALWSFVAVVVLAVGGLVALQLQRFAADVAVERATADEMARAVFAVVTSLESDDVVRTSEQRLAFLDRIIAEFGARRDRFRDPDVMDRMVAVAHQFAVSEHVRRGDEEGLAAGRWHAEQALQIWERMIARRPEWFFDSRYTEALVKVGDSFKEAADYATAREWYERAFAIDLEILARRPDDAAAESGVGFGYYRIADLDQRFDRPILEGLEQAIVHLERARALRPDSPQDHADVAEVLMSWAAELNYSGRRAEAPAAWQRAIDAAEEALRRARLRGDPAPRHIRMAMRARRISAETGADPVVGLRHALEAVQELERLVLLDPHDTWSQEELGHCLAAVGSTKAQIAGPLAGAADCLRAADLLRTLGPTLARHHAVRAWAVAVFYLRKAGRAVEAEQESQRLISSILVDVRDPEVGFTLRRGLITSLNHHLWAHPDAARALLSWFAETFPDPDRAEPWARLVAVRALIHLGREPEAFERAVPLYQDLDRLAADSPDDHAALRTSMAEQFFVDGLPGPYLPEELRGR